MAEAHEYLALTDDSDQVVTKSSHYGNYKSLLRKTLYIIFALCGQAAASLLGRLYYDKGGSKKWLETVVQVAGFPIMFLFHCCMSSPKHNATNHVMKETPSVRNRAIVYILLGVLVATSAFLYSVSLEYLSASTVSLITASQLAFNAFFSYFLNSQKFTPYIINSLVLLTISSVVLVFQDHNSDEVFGVSHGKYALGFICAILMTASNGLIYSSQQFVLQKVLKSQTLKDAISLILWQSTVALVVILVGFSASGDWKGLNIEMEEYELGKVSYVTVLVSTSLCWALLFIGNVGLVFEVSALFCNSINTVGLPIVPIGAIIVFHEKMTVLKAISLVLAIWGFISYAYQHYLDEYQPNTKEGKTNEINEPNSLVFG